MTPVTSSGPVAAMEKALAQLKLNQRNLCRGMSASIQKMQARENEEAIQSLSAALEDARQEYRSVPHGHCTHPRCKEWFIEYLDIQSRLSRHEGGSVMVLNANTSNETPEAAKTAIHSDSSQAKHKDVVQVGIDPESSFFTLGARLAKNMVDEKNGSIEAARRLEMHQSEAMRAKFKLVQDFFTRARTHFECSILDGVFSKRMYIQVGGPAFSRTPITVGALFERDMYSVSNQTNICDACVREVSEFIGASAQPDLEKKSGQRLDGIVRLALEERLAVAERQVEPSTAASLNTNVNLTTPLSVPNSPPATASKTPLEIVSFLSDYVIGQQDAKESLAIAVYNHYKRLNFNAQNSANPGSRNANEILNVEISKSNVLMLGPTGTGKTLLAQTVARMLDVPFAIADATSLTQAGYVGDDVETILQRLVQAADGDVEKAERGIVFIDEIDKISRATAGTSITRDVSGEGVQQALLKIIEGSKVSVPNAGNRKMPGAASVMVDTKNILFICAGAFVQLLEKLKTEEKRDMGFLRLASAKDKPDAATDGAPAVKEVTPEMLIEFGMIPEFVGRVPVITVLEQLSVADMEKILVEPKNAVCKQMQALFSLDGAELVFEDGAIGALAKKAIELKTGARGARAQLEKILKPAMLNVPSNPDSSVVVIFNDYANHGVLESPQSTSFVALVLPLLDAKTKSLLIL